MTVVRDEARGVYASLTKCKRCGGPIYFGYSQTGRRVAFDASPDEGGAFLATRDPHDGQSCQVQQALNALGGDL